MEIILYYIDECKELLISFLILIFFLGILFYLGIRKFNQEKKIKVILYGLLLNINNVDVVKLSIIIIKTYLSVFAIMVVDEITIAICMIMICILTVIYLILSRKKILKEIIYTCMQLAMIFFIYLMNSYLSNIEYSQFILIVKTIITVFALMSITYLFLTDINILSENRMDKELKKSRESEQ
jgi:hypothetical protein